jgi:hypothetical protein
MLGRKRSRESGPAETYDDLESLRILCGETEDPEEPPFELLIESVRSELPTNYPSHIIAQSVAESKGYPMSTYTVRGSSYLRIHTSKSIFVDYRIQ